MEMVLSPSIQFPRSLRSPQVIGRPEIIGFFDGSDQAFCGVVYIRWHLEDEDDAWHTTLVTSKARVTPGQGTTTPRSELSALVLLVRLIDTVIMSIELPPIRVTIMGDSTCVVAACDLNANALQPYFSNRVVEVITTMKKWGVQEAWPVEKELTHAYVQEEESKCVVDPIQHVPGTRNIADMPTRGNIELETLNLDTSWQNGPDFLQDNRKT